LFVLVFILCPLHFLHLNINFTNSVYVFYNTLYNIQVFLLLA
jgi:hypothetical protein